MRNSGTFWRNHLLLPLLGFVVLALLLENSHIDLHLADLIYSAEGGSWALRNSYLFSELLHAKVQGLMKILAAGLFTVAILSHFINVLKPYRKALWFLALVMPLSSLLVATLKGVTHVDCPWDLLRYGGEHPYIRLFQAHPGTYKFGKCFPAGHAGAGYTFMALYFFFSVIRPEWKKYGLATGIALGLLFGIAQQIRGAHFISHDLWTAAICWFNSLAWYWLVFLRRQKSDENVAETAGQPERQDSESLNEYLTSGK